MEIGIDWMMVVAQWVAALPGAVGRIAAFGTGPLLVASVGIIVLGLLRTPLRWCGGAALLVAIGWALATPQPDILVAGDGHQVGVRSRDGRLRMIQAGKDAFLLKEWLAADADPRTSADPSLADAVSCDPDGCVAAFADGAMVALALRAEALADDCERATLIVTTMHAPAGCTARVIGPDELRRSGAMALRLTGGGFVTVAARPKAADRPWSPAVAEEPAVDSVTTRSPRAPPVDATPPEPEQHDED
jgi:competence protein ComEC